MNKSETREVLKIAQYRAAGLGADFAARALSALISFADVTRNPVIGETMTRHQLTYVDLHPEPVKPEPSSAAIVAGAAAFMLGLCLIVSFAFSL